MGWEAAEGSGWVVTEVDGGVAKLEPAQLQVHTCYIGIVGKQQYCSETVTLGNELGKRRGWGCFATVAGRPEIAPRSATRADSPNDLPGRFSWVGVS